MVTKCCLGWWYCRCLQIAGLTICRQCQNDCMTHALRVLEWDRVREQLLSQCESALGGMLASELLPSHIREDVVAKQALTTDALRMYDTGLPGLRGLYDVGEPAKLASKGAVLEGTTLAKIGQSVRVVDAARKVILGYGGDIQVLRMRAEMIPDLGWIGAKLDRCFDLDGEMLDEASPALALARSNKAKANKRILEKIHSYTTGPSREYLSDTVFTQRNGRYVIPLKAEHKGKVRGIVHDSSASGSTIYVEPEAVVELGNQLRQAEVAEQTEIKRILKELSAEVGMHSQEIGIALDTGAELDLVFGMVRLGVSQDGCLVELVSGEGIKVSKGRHPLLEREKAVPLSLTLGLGEPSILITGPNTGGKTIAMKTVGLFIAMAQSGMMVPAQIAEVGVVSQIWADIGDEQSLEQSLSTFSGHIKNIAYALGQLRAGALVLIDEVGAGTDPDEGAALASALLNAFLDRGAVVMASTHYGELKMFASDHPKLVNASMEFDLKSLAPTYRFLAGTPGSSHALKIASRYGVPKDVIESAELGFSDQERNVGKMLEQLEHAQRRAQKAQSEADKLAARLKRVEEEAERKIEQAEAARRRVGERASNELNELLRQIRIEAEDVFELVKRDRSQGAIDEARNRLRSLNEAGAELSREVKPVEKEEDRGIELRKGVKVKVRSLNMTGILLADPKSGKVAVQAGALRLDMDVKDLVPLEAPLKQVVKKRSAGSKVATRMRLEKAQKLRRELHLRQMRAEEAEETLDRFLDDAIVAGVDEVRIVHGKGTGVLRKLTHDMLRRHSQVLSYEEADAGDGGQGATIARLQ
jgi:DNA mismatch repair protein MutS2